MDKKMLHECPYCMGERFAVDWSEMDKRTWPIEMTERYICEACGKKFIQFWDCNGWRSMAAGGMKSGDGFLQKCVECGSDDIGVQVGEAHPTDENLFTERYKCEGCGVEHTQIWKAREFKELREEKRNLVSVEDHYRNILSDDDDKSELEGKALGPVEGNKP